MSTKPPFDADFTKAHNAACYALGALTRNNRFRARKIVWGRLMARAERRPGEEIRRASISVNRTKSR